MIILVGKTCSGKSTITKKLEEEYYIPRIRTYTTRPRRDGEDENEYHFISEEKFKKYKEEGFFFETTQYNVASGDTWYYGTAKTDLEITGRSCIIMNPDGVKKIHHMCIINPTIIYLNITEGYQWSRLRARGCDADEAQRRVVADNKDFADIDKYYDFAITTDNFSPSEIASLIIKFDRFKHH